MHKAFKKYKVFVYPDANMAADQSQSVFYKIIYIYIYILSYINMSYRLYYFWSINVQIRENF